MCAAELAAPHTHVFDRKAGQLRCACATCERLLVVPGAPWTAVRHRVERLPGFTLTDAHWRALALPIDLAFFVTSSAAGRVIARYPSAAGTVESSLALPAWQSLVAANPVLDALEPDVEALLVNRAGERREHYLASIDECYRLVGLIRLHWRGVGGGAAVWEAIDRFFGELAGRSAAV